MMNNFTQNVFTFRKKSLKSFVATIGLFLALILSSSSFAQTNSYLGLNGGFEGTATIVDGTINSAPVATNWTKSTTTATITSETGTVRSGVKSLKVTSASGTLCRVFSPSMTVAASTTKWQVQYYRNSTSATNTVQNQTGNYRNGTEQANGAYTVVSAANTWEKVTYSPTTATSATTAAAHMLVKQLGTGGSTFYDDFVLYESATIDVTAPSVPGSITFSGQTSNSIDLSWVAASGGVDGGGYLVVRGTVDPTTAPNVNGIYASGNTISGGTVVYQGTGTSFTDSGLSASTTYYYRIYTYDKAYNYSAATTDNSSTASSFTIGWCNLQYPGTQTITEGGSFTVYGRVYAAGLTDSVGQGAGLTAWVGYSTSNVNPNSGSWTWVPLTYFGDDGTNNDEYSGSLGSGITPGTYYYATRFQIGAGAYSYGGTGGVWNSDNGVLTVNSNLVDWGNVQFPTSGTITQGDNFNVYAQVYKAGVTNTGSPGAGITAWIGYSSSNTNPNTGGWTWVSTTFNADAGNNDEYVANIGLSLTAGTYYYASRFQMSGSSEYVYGGTAGIWSSDSGTLTVNALGVPTAIAATTIADTSFDANWNAVTGATSYRLDVSTSPAFGVTSSSNVSEGFNAGTTPPTGWVFNAVTATYTSATNFGVSSPSLKLDATNDAVTTDVYPANANQLSFWIKGQATDAISSLLVEGYNGTSWTTIENISNLPTTTSGATYTYNSGTTPALPSNLIKFRFTYTKSVGNLAFDDVSVDYDVVTPSFVSGYQDLNVGSVTTYNVTGLTPNTTYYYRVRAVNGAITTADSNVISATTLPGTCTWDGTAWSNTVGPDVNTEAIIAGVYSTTANGSFTANKLTISSGSLTVNAGTSITVVNEVINSLTAADVIVENNANLIQTNASATNTGSITVKRDSSALIRNDYTLWSSPVAAQNLLAFSPLTSISPNVRFYTYNTTTNLYNAVASPSTTSFTVGQGYLIRVPFNHPTAPAIWHGAFSGVANNGTQSVSLANVGIGQRFNLVGNPYPSAIDMATFVSENSADITGTLYFWRKTNSLTSSPGYCTWAGGTFTSNGEAQVYNPSGVIRTGQGFIVEASATGSSVSFNNTQRVADTANQFFRNSATEYNRIWLNATNTNGAFSQMAVGYITDATQGVDAFDGKYFNNGEIALNSIIDNNDYTIQGRALPFVTSDVVPLSFKATNAGSYTISIDHVDGLFSGATQDIFLRDNLLSTTTNLNNGSYSFASQSGTFTDRFELVYENALGVNQSVFNTNNVVVYKSGSDFVINSGNVNMKSVKVFDVRGRLLVEKNNVNTTQTIVNVGNTNQVLLIQITSVDNETITKKVVN